MPPAAPTTMAELPDDGAAHRALVALSFAPALAPAARARLGLRARRALALLCAGAVPRTSLEEDDLLVLEAGSEAPRHLAEDGALALSFGVGGTDWRRERPCEAPHLLAGLRAAGVAAVADFTPPFAALFRRRRGAPLEVATDARGLFRVYVTAGAGFAACGSSCLALGALRDDGPDLESLAGYGRLDFYLGARTPMAGVRRLLPGEGCTLAAGAPRIAPWAQAPRREPPFGSFAEAVDAGAAALRAAVGSLAAAHPRIGLSLSGGLDSRLLLAALPPERRAALEVLCIDAPGRGDAPLVRRLAAGCGFAPTFADTSRFPAARAVALARGAARRRDHSANPLFTAVLDWAESALPATPRLNGQNGELARGQYYGGDPTSPGEVTRERTAALVRGRLFGPQQVAPRVFAPAYREPVMEALEDEIHAWLAATGLPWLDAVDELYLGQRMAGWVGIELSRTSMRRVDLSPFLDPRFVAFARRAAPADKRGSRLMAAIVDAIDPALAALPLDGRPAPAAIWRGTPASRSAAPPAARPAPRRAPDAAALVPAGADLVRAQVLADAEAAGVSLARAATLPLFDAGALAGALRPDSPLDVATLGFVLNVEWMLEFLEQARAEPAPGA